MRTFLVLTVIVLGAGGLSGCVDGNITFSELLGAGEGESGEGLSGLTGAVAAVPAPPTEVAAPQVDVQPEPAVAEPEETEEAASAEETNSEPDAEPAPETEETEAPEESAPEEAEVVQSAPCVQRVVIDYDRTIIDPMSNAGSAYEHQGVTAWYRVYDANIERTGVAIGYRPGTDFCHLTDAYPCVWESIPRTEIDPQSEEDAWFARFGFINVEGGAETEAMYGRSGQDTYRDFTDYDVRAWVLMKDGTLVLDGFDHARWGTVRSYDATGAHDSGVEETDFCDAIASGLQPQSG